MSREAFEKVMLSIPWMPLEFKFENGRYVDEQLNAGFITWQAQQARIDELTELAKDGRRYRSLMMSRLICNHCGGAGFVGSPPDDYYDCPACTAKENYLHAELERVKGGAK